MVIVGWNGCGDGGYGVDRDGDDIIFVRGVNLVGVIC